jgi:hypothetical protein
MVFSANGSHANYAIDGIHDHDLGDLHLPTPGFVNDYTDAGPLWDPIKNAYWYEWTAPPIVPTNATPPPLQNPTRDTNKWGTFTTYDKITPLGYLYFNGRWGDYQYNSSDPRQDSLLGLAWKYETGPTGPADKNIARKEVWSTTDGILLSILVP